MCKSINFADTQAWLVPAAVNGSCCALPLASCLYHPIHKQLPARAPVIRHDQHARPGAQGLRLLQSNLTKTLSDLRAQSCNAALSSNPAKQPCRAALSSNPVKQPYQILFECQTEDVFQSNMHEVTKPYALVL